MTVTSSGNDGPTLQDLCKQVEKDIGVPRQGQRLIYKGTDLNRSRQCYCAMGAQQKYLPFYLMHDYYEGQALQKFMAFICYSWYLALILSIEIPDWDIIQPEYFYDKVDEYIMCVIVFSCMWKVLFHNSGMYFVAFLYLSSNSGWSVCYPRKLRYQRWQ